MYIVGLTGGIGSGKTAVSDLFQAKAITVVDADVCARVVVDRGRPALQSIAQRFGQDILFADGSLDRAALRQHIFANAEDKQWLERLLHPLIRDEVAQQILQSTSPYTLLVSPLLIESKQNQICDRVLLVDVPEELQIERTMQRDDNHAEQVKRIMQTQADRATRLAAADDVINNVYDFAYLEKQVDALHQQYMQLASNKLG